MFAFKYGAVIACLNSCVRHGMIPKANNTIRACLFDIVSIQDIQLKYIRGGVKGFYVEIASLGESI